MLCKQLSVALIVTVQLLYPALQTPTELRAVAVRHYRDEVVLSKTSAV